MGNSQYRKPVQRFKVMKSKLINLASSFEKPLRSLFSFLYNFNSRKMGFLYWRTKKSARRRKGISFMEALQVEEKTQLSKR